MAKKTKTQADEEFEKLVREFIDSEFDSDDTSDEELLTDNLDDPLDSHLPFPREVDGRVADAMMNMEHENGDFQRDVASVSLEIAKGCEKGVWWNAPVSITFTPRTRARLSPSRFKCYVYNDTFFPVCYSKEGQYSIKRSRKKPVTMEISCNQVWTPGNYILLISDSCGSSVIRIEFSLDKDMQTTLGEPRSIFTGNPGTGKTTVARKLGKIYRSLGLLSKGEVIAVDRTRLVGRYIGDTEDNMKHLFEEAKGNVLFIDEAYTLYDGAHDRKDFGARVIDSLLTTLTQPNPDMLVVFAGYPKEMQAMLDTNPGLAGRFPYRYQFDDYSAEQLKQIARHLLERDEYILSDEAAKAMQEAINQTLSMKSPNFGNARWIEQFVNNGIIPAMADRIFSTGCTDFQRVEVADVNKAFEQFKPKAIDLKPTRHRVKGFSA